MNAPAGACRRVGDGGEQFGRGPLHALRAILHVEHRTSCGRRNGIDQRELLCGRPRRADEPLPDFLAHLGRQYGKDRSDGP